MMLTGFMTNCLMFSCIPPPPLRLLRLQAFSAVSIMEIASSKATGKHTQQQGSPVHCNSLVLAFSAKAQN
jgi:hypothetical protein